MSTVPYWHDRVLNRIFLRFLPARLTPNQVTVFRLVATPFVAAAVWSQQYDFAIPLFLAVAFTDMVDGSLARIRDQVTDWGKLWDPVADKVLVGSVAALLLFQQFPPDLAIVVFGLEAIFLLGGYYRKRQGHIVSANRWGKAKMFLQVFGLVFYMLSLALELPVLAMLSYAVLILATFFALMSLFTLGV